MHQIISLIKNQTFLFLILLTLWYLVSLFSSIYFIDISKLSYELFSYTLLWLWLYAWVYWIDISEFKKHKKLVLSAISFWVILKSIIIWWLLYFFTHNPLSFIFWVIVAQIDPISVGYLLKWGKDKRLSCSGETVLRAWSAFDDPMTVLLSLYVFLPFTLQYIQWGNLIFNFQEYFQQLWVNILFVWIIYCMYKIITQQKNTSHKIQIYLLFFTITIGIYFQLMLSIAVIALFLRPNIEYIIEYITSWAFYAASFLLWILLITNFNILWGIFIAIFCIFSQIISAFLLANKFSFQDRVYLGFGQQNGITSIILAVLIFQYFPSTVWYIAPAIIVINILHYILNRYADLYFFRK